MDTEEQNEDFQRLHQLIAGTGDITSFLDGMTRLAATTLSRVTGIRIECAATLCRRKRAVTLAGSSDDAILWDGIEQALGDGPVMEALQTNQPVTLKDTSTAVQWPQYSNALAEAGARSVLAVPLELGDDASAALNFFAPATGAFSNAPIAEAVVFADTAGQALRLALRIATADLLAEDLKAAMARRTVIDLSTGIIMAESNCTQEEAFRFLHLASQNRNQKLHDVAASIVSERNGARATPATHFED
ncbi:GAF and ANTAR domain-containing protein [Paenarthrobacter sp. NPDC089322]|uniref:GAF and ANTAR domain-containing protein n=1 Tax=Paenarthrobacter sp. NPDC089322 TaxID=3155065 RepID=UPI0034259E72